MGHLMDVFNKIEDAIKKSKYSLISNGKSRHLDTPIDFNEDNGGIGLMATNGNYYATVGGYKNSFNKPSYYAGYGYDKKFGSLEV